MKDDKSEFLNAVEKGNEDYNGLLNNTKRPLMKIYPFLMGIWKQQLIDIGGYDEDFIGTGYDDNDIVHRLKTDECEYHDTPCAGVHLWHPRGSAKGQDVRGRQAYNKKLLEKRKSQIVRNVGKDWGRI